MPGVDRIGATLETIPTELKLMIADHFDPDVPLDLRWSQMEQHEAQSRRPTLASLSLVSRSWAAVLGGLRWQSLHIRASDTVRLLELARDYMPRYGAKVKTLLFTWWTVVDLENLDRLDGTPHIQQSLNALECFTGLRDPSEASILRMVRLHDALIATILRACPNLLGLKARPETTAARYLSKYDDGEVAISPGRTKDALYQIGRGIRRADLSRVQNCRSALKYLEMTPNIELLSIRAHAKSSLLDMRHLVQTLSGMPQLFSLEFDSVHPTALEILSALPCSKMTQMVLSGTLSPQLQNLSDALKIHPITSLSLRDWSPSDGPPPSSRPQDLKIQNLSIAGRSASVLLDLFDAAPLKHVELCACRGSRNSNRINPNRITAFIKKHRATLLSFKIDRAILAPSVDVSVINRSLEEEGISVRVVTVG
ncbi:hypothetical protein C6P46_004479 [Rhodotorula mucilaginosa]|uniref:F-box domain-containing protein n=1 Tax=Rhodotorula mucilaginosa TaxID=5537 RepID=A0A9P6W2J2_RHOMI|nr:hypothetical protein C6P46_004479 [Rhodotorula mucilaginosa]TKA51960.1 hypothetical protein B0A53_05044 [Rhodotorula sp. CCFEE 5036]